MIINLILLGSVLGVSYQSWRKQRETYNKKLFDKHQKTTSDLKENINQKKNLPVSSSTKKRTNSKEFASLVTAMGLSSIGYGLYYPLSYLSVPFILFSLRKKLYSAWGSVKKGKLEVETLAVITIFGAIIGQRFFIGSLLGAVNVIGDILISRVIRESHHQLVDIYQDMPKMVWLLKDNLEISIPLSDIQRDDILVVNAGEMISADGEIVWGSAGIDEHRLTGESIPVEKNTGEKVFAMTVVLSGKIHFKIEQAGAKTSAMKIANIINETSDYKSLTVLEYETFSSQLIKPALITSMIALPVLGFSAAIAVLFAHPKERLKVAAPLSLLRYLKQSTQEGMLIKDGRSLELLNKVDTIVFDKTGTLTEEQPHVGNIYSFSNYTENDILYFVAVAEYKQTHPVALAILDEANQRNITFSQPDHSEYHLGYGIKVMLNEKMIVVGSQRFMESEAIHIPESSQHIQETAKQQGYSLIMVAVDKQLIGIIELLPTIRPEAKEIIKRLKQLKQIKKIYIISGDAPAPTMRLARKLDIDDSFAQVLPQQKAEIIEKLQQEGHFICYVGDGINDAIAMKQAQVSVSLSGASQLAVDTAQILLLDNGIKHLPRLFELAQGFNKHMKVQLSVIFIPSVIGMSAIFLTGMGMGGMMILNILTLSTSIGYSVLDRPKLLKVKKLNK